MYVLYVLTWVLPNHPTILACFFSIPWNFPFNHLVTNQPSKGPGHRAFFKACIANTALISHGCVWSVKRWMDRVKCCDADIRKNSSRSEVVQIRSYKMGWLFLLVSGWIMDGFHFSKSVWGYIRQLCDISFHRIRPAAGVSVRPDCCSFQAPKIVEIAAVDDGTFTDVSLHYLQIPEGDVFIWDDESRFIFIMRQPVKAYRFLQDNSIRINHKISIISFKY